MPLCSKCGYYRNHFKSASRMRMPVKFYLHCARLQNFAISERLLKNEQMDNNGCGHAISTSICDDGGDDKAMTMVTTAVSSVGCNCCHNCRQFHNERCYGRMHHWFMSGLTFGQSTIDNATKIPTSTTRPKFAPSKILAGSMKVVILLVPN